MWWALHAAGSAVVAVVVVVMGLILLLITPNTQAYLKQHLKVITMYNFRMYYSTFKLNLYGSV
jgi:fumarate reductase subunit D